MTTTIKVRKPINKRPAMLVAVIVGFALLFSAWYVGSPIWTVHQMKAAAEARDSAKLTNYIDYPQLRENLKRDLAQKMAGSPDMPGDGGAGPANILVSTMMNALIDTLVTPQTIEKIFSENAAVARKAKETPTKQDDGNITIERQSFNRFDLVTTGDKPDDKLVLEFQRNGLSWKMVALHLPEGPAGLDGPIA